MKQNISLKGLLLAVIALFGVVSMSAQNRLSIEPANFISHDVVKLQVNFDKVNPVAGMDFQVALPDFLEFVGKSVERNESRFTSNTTISFNPKNGKVLIASFAETELQGESGALLYIPVKVKDGYNTEMSGDITVGNITFTTWNGKESWSQDAFQVAASYNPYKIEFAPVAETVAINAGTSSDLGIAISAECDVIGFQAVVSVPEGYTLGERAVLSDRCPGDANMTLRKDGNTYRLIYYTLSNSPMSGNEGLAFTLKVTAPEGAPENATIEFKDIVVSYAAGKSANANNFTVNVISGTPANNRLTEKLNGLENELNAAVAEIAEKYPAVKDQFTGSAVSEAIETLRGEIATAFADGSLIGKEAGFNDRCDAISAEIAKLITDAAAANSDLQESNRVAANNAAYDATKAEIAALQAALEAAKSQAAANYPGTNNETAVNAAQEAINKASEGAKAALEAVASEGTYSYTVDNEGINALIAAIDESAKAQYEEAQRVAANQAAYKASTDEIAALQTALNAAKLNVAQKYPGTDVEAQTDAAQQAIDKAGEEAKAALEAVASEGTYNYTVDKEGINALIAAITEAAKAQYEDAQRVAANQAAYKATMGEIVALQNALNAAKLSVAQKYPGTDVEAQAQAAQQAIDNAKEGAKAALEAVASEGTYNYTVDKEGINALIAAITEAGKVQYEEAQRVAANNAAYKATTDELAALQNALNAAKLNVAQKYPGTDVEAEAEAAQQAINAAAEAAKTALDAVENAGTYNYSVDKAGINKLIDAIVPAAKAKYEEAQRVAANEAAYKATSEEIAALQAKLEAAKASAAQQYPNTDTEAQQTAAQQAIDAAKAGADAAYQAVAQSGKYNYTFDKAEINKLIEAIPAAAKAQYEEAQRVAANEAAYKAVTEKLAALQSALDAAKAEAAEKYGDIDVTSEVAAAQNSINAAKAAADAIYKAVATAGVFSYDVPVADIEALINAVTAKAVAGSEANRKAHNKAAYDKAIATIDALQKELDAAVEAAEKNCPHANITSVLNKAQTAITNARNDANVAYIAVDKAGVYSYTVDEAGIRALIEALSKSAAEQEAAYNETQRVAANKAAYESIVAEINVLQASLEAAKETAATQYPNADVSAEVAAAQNAIDAAKADAAKALEAVAAEGVFNYTVDKDGINKLIEAVNTSAAEQEAAYNEAQRVAANKAAYEAAVAEIDALQTALDAAKETVAAQYPDANVSAEVAAAQSAIDAAKADAAKALEAVANEGTFNYAVDKDGINNLIDAIAASAADQKEAARVAANKAAYEATLADIAKLQEALVAAKAEAESTYPESNVDALVAEVQAAIDDITSAANQSFDAVAAAGEYDYTFDSKPVEEMIAGIVPEAKKQADEAKRVAANEAAYQASLDKIAALRESLSTVKDKIAAEYPELDVTVLVNAADDAIIKAEADAAAEYQSVAEEGVYSYEVPVAEIEALIQEILTYAEENAVDSVYADDIDENTLIYTLSGVRVTRPQQGKVNILVSKDGSARKVFVK